MKALPPFTVHVAKLVGAPYQTTTIKVDGQVIRSVIGPLSDAQIREYVRAHVEPITTPPVQPTRVTQGRGKPGPRGKRSPEVNARGFLWRGEDE